MIWIPDDVISKIGKLVALWIVISSRYGDIDVAILISFKCTNTTIATNTATNTAAATTTITTTITTT